VLRIAIFVACMTATSHADTFSPRKLSGMPRPDEATPRGTVVVRLVYDDPNDKPPVGVPVTLVGYAADDRVTVVKRSSDATGNASFPGLDHSGAVAYYALAELPRGRHVDRLMSTAIVLGATGVRVMLSAEKRSSTEPALDYFPLRGPAVPSGRIRVALDGVLIANAAITLVDATTGKVAATGTATGPALELAAPKGAVLYATATTSHGTYRSLPFAPTAGRGTEILVIAYPRLLVRYTASTEIDTRALTAMVRVRIDNNSWIPHAVANGLEIPLPRGFAKLEIEDFYRDVATLTKAGFKIGQPIAPGGITLRAVFELPVVGGKARWDLDLPFGTFQSSFAVSRDPGVTIEPSAGLMIETTDRWLGVSNITLAKNKSMVITVTAPKLSAAETTLRAACKPMLPERAHVLLGKPMPPTVTTALDGKPLDLAKLRGKYLLVNFNATFNSRAHTEPPSLGKLAAAIRSLEIVTVFSDADRADVEKVVGTNPPYRIALDPPVSKDSALGPITTAWSVPAIPETFLVDKQGIVRWYFVNVRDWGSREAIACLQAIMR
jgi:Redoxin